MALRQASGTARLAGQQAPLCSLRKHGSPPAGTPTVMVMISGVPTGIFLYDNDNRDLFGLVFALITIQIVVLISI